jgi:hypothetical protein
MYKSVLIAFMGILCLGGLSSNANAQLKAIKNKYVGAFLGASNDGKIMLFKSGMGGWYHYTLDQDLLKWISYSMGGPGYGEHSVAVTRISPSGEVYQYDFHVEPTATTMNGYSLKRVYDEDGWGYRADSNFLRDVKVQPLWTEESSQELLSSQLAQESIRKHVAADQSGMLVQMKPIWLSIDHSVVLFSSPLDSTSFIYVISSNIR